MSEEVLKYCVSFSLYLVPSNNYVRQSIGSYSSVQFRHVTKLRSSHMLHILSPVLCERRCCRFGNIHMELEISYEISIFSSYKSKQQGHKFELLCLAIV